MAIEINVEPGKYVVAVSGGVDSVVLLDLLAQQKDLELIIVHVNHGIRPDEQTKVDELLATELANKHNLDLIITRLELGKSASEDKARQARHEVLRQTLRDKSYNKIITAHHKDDVIETMIINLIRGTGRKGLSSLKNDDAYLRPLLNVSKQQIINYAKDKQLSWNDDSTNTDTKYLRNYVRLNILPRMISQQMSIKQELYNLYLEMLKLNDQIDHELETLDALINQKNEDYERLKFIMLPIEVSYTYLHFILSGIGLEVDAQMLKRVRNFIHTAQAGKLMNISKSVNLMVGPKTFSFASTQDTKHSTK